jgi:hypothetical protein
VLAAAAMAAVLVALQPSLWAGIPIGAAVYAAALAALGGIDRRALEALRA